MFIILIVLGYINMEKAFLAYGPYRSRQQRVGPEGHCQQSPVQYTGRTARMASRTHHLGLVTHPKSPHTWRHIPAGFSVLWHLLCPPELLRVSPPLTAAQTDRPAQVSVTALLIGVRRLWSARKGKVLSCVLEDTFSPADGFLFRIFPPESKPYSNASPHARPDRSHGVHAPAVYWPPGAPPASWWLRKLGGVPRGLPSSALNWKPNAAFCHCLISHLWGRISACL